MPATTGSALDFLFEDVGPGTDRLTEVGVGEELLIAGPFGNGFALRRRERWPVLIAGGIGLAPIVAFDDELRDLDGVRATTFVGMRIDRSRLGRRRSTSLEHELATEDGSAGSPGLRHRTGRAASRRSSRDSDGLRLRTAGDARSRSRALRRAGRAVPARDGVRHGLRLRCLLRLRRPDQGRLHAALRRRTGDRWATSSTRQSSPGRGTDGDVEFCGIELEHPIVNGSGTYDALAARRVFGDAFERNFPFSAYVSKTITLEPRAGNPPPRLWELGQGMINSIGLPNKGLVRFVDEDLPDYATLPAPLIVSVMGFNVDELSRSSRRSTAAMRSLPSN